MNTLAKTILAHTQELPEGEPISAKEMLHLGSRAAVDQAFSRLVRRGRLLRVSRGVYVRLVESRFGKRAPSLAKVLAAFGAFKGETIVPHGAAAANKLGLTPQVPVRAVYLTSGPSRRLTLGAQVVELRHAPRWQLALAGRLAGEVLHALAWLGPEKAGKALRTLKPRLSRSELDEIASARSILPAWLAEQVSEIVVNG